MTHYPCSICGKQYKRLGNLKRHRLICELFCRSTDCQEAEHEEVTDCPSRMEMWRIIKIQAVQLDTLKKEIQSLKRSNIGAHRKIKVLEWLNQQVKPKLSYAEWVTTATLSEKHLQMIFDTNYIKGLVNIIQSVFLMDEGDYIPLYAFQHKKNILYYFNGNKWEVMQFSIFKQWVDTLHTELMAYFNDWYTQNLSSISSLQSGAHWQENVSKMMGGGKDPGETIQHIKISLYNTLKVTFASVR